MSDRQLSFKALLAEFQGLRIVAERLSISENHRLLVVSRVTNVHPSRGPDQFLDKQMLHDALLNLMEVCHMERDGMWLRSRMEPRFWSCVRASTPWAVGVSEEILRTLALGLTQAAWAHFLNPKRNSKGVPQPHCKLAIAALRFADDVATYESHLKQPEDITDMNFLEFRGKVYRGNGKRLIGPDGKQVTQPVFPAYGYHWAIDPLPAGQLSVEYDLTRDEPEIFKQLQRV